MTHSKKNFSRLRPTYPTEQALLAYSTHKYIYPLLMSGNLCTSFYLLSVSGLHLQYANPQSLPARGQVLTFSQYPYIIQAREQYYTHQLAGDSHSTQLNILFTQIVRQTQLFQMLLYAILLLLFHANVCDSSPPNASRILNTTRIFPLSSLVSVLSPNVSRDAPYILHLPSEHGSQFYKPFWVFSDTETFNAKGDQTGFVSNSAGWDSSDREAILDVVIMGKNSSLALGVTDVLASTEGTIREQWIPYTKEELSFNDVNKKGSKKRIALCEHIFFIPLHAWSTLCNKY